MEISLPKLRREEEVALRLRALFEEKGYRLYRMGSFEEYDLYMQNKPFLMGDDIITFTGADGRLMALKPDVTLSIVKNTRQGEARRVYYTENVFRRGRQNGEYREISQIGLESIGQDGAKAEAEVLALAVDSLAVLGNTTLDVSHIGVMEAVLALFPTEEQRADARLALRDKSPHAMRAAATAAGLDPALSQALCQLAELSGPFAETYEKALPLVEGIPGAGAALAGLYGTMKGLLRQNSPVCIRLDFSIINDVDYYNGLVFQGFANGLPVPVLTGGRYDNLLRRFDKPQSAAGFALYLDMLGRLPTAPGDAPGVADEEAPWLNVALPKGRLATKMHKLFAKIGFAAGEMDKESRKLIWEDRQSKIRYFLVKPTDVDIYVEHGVADIGVVGKDILLENSSDVMELLDLGFGKCRLAVAGRTDFAEDPANALRVATKYPAVARRYYAQKSRSVEIIKLHGSIELAPLVGLSDVIVDIVETGSTLRENGLDVLEEIASSSARLIANRASWRFKQTRIEALAHRLEEQL